MKLFKKNNLKNVFMGKRKVENYLKQFNNEDTAQAKLLRMYTDGELEEILIKYSFDVIEIYVDGSNKLGLDLQINLRNGNRNYAVDFFNEYYETCFYLAGCKPEDVENSIVKHNYQDFDLETFLQEVEAILNKNIHVIGTYRYNDDISLIEITIDESPDKLQLDEFYLFDKSVSQKNSQAPYLEQFLDLEGKSRISDIYGNVESVNEGKSRVAFFMFNVKEKSIVKTPYGALMIERIENMPDRLKDIIEFEMVD